MNSRTCKLMKVLAAAWLAAGMISSASALAIEGRFERTLTVTGPVELSVVTGAGDISVHTGDSATVHVTGIIKTTGRGLEGGPAAEKKVRELESNPPIEQHGNLIKIGHIEDRELQRHISISYHLVVPAQTRLRSQSGSGDQTIEGIAGQLDASSGSGDLKISNIGDTVHVSTGSGDVRVDGTKGSVRTSTGSGDVSATGVAGGLHADTGSGDITLEQTASGDVEVSAASGTVRLKGVHGSLRAHTASGNISAQGTGAGSWRLDSASGDVDIQLPAQQGFNLHARSVSGDIQTARQMTVQGTVSGRELNGKVGDGGFLLEVSTVSGAIRIE